MRILDWIKLIRAREQLSTAEFASRLELHRNVVHKWEHGDTRPSFASIRSIGETFALVDSERLGLYQAAASFKKKATK